MIADPANPICCKSCNNPSSPSTVYCWINAILIVFGFSILAPINAFFQGNWVPLLSFLVAAIILEFFYVIFIPVVALEGSKVKKRKSKIKRIQLLLGAVILVVIVWFLV